VLKRGTDVERKKWPVIRSNLEMVPDKMQVCIVTYELSISTKVGDFNAERRNGRYLASLH